MKNSCNQGIVAMKMVNDVVEKILNLSVGMYLDSNWYPLSMNDDFLVPMKQVVKMVHFSDDDDVVVVVVVLIEINEEVVEDDDELDDTNVD